MKTAVILAARKERDSEIPYPLLPFDGKQCLIDRTLSILRRNGFERILLVAGYRTELFDRYVADDLILIENKDFEFTSSMGSLALCKDYIDEDFLLIEGDTFFESKLVERLSAIESGNCLAITEESGSGDECFVETKCGFVKKITKDRHRVCNFEGELIGVLRIALDTYTRILDEWNVSSNPHLNYEYLLMDVTDALDRPCIHFKNLIWGDVDCKEDFIKLREEIYPTLRRKENPYDKENLKAHLKRIFGDKNISEASITKIGGMSNKNFKVDFEGRSYVLRIPGNGSEGMVERANEEFNASEACRLGVNPEIRFFDAQTGVKLADFVENDETLNAATIQRHDNMKKVASIYKTLHDSHIRLKNEFNIFREIERYDLLLEKSKGCMYAGWETVKPKVMHLEHYLNSIGVELKPCHNDALYENFIKDPTGKIYLIDWEYSGMNDPMADIAALFLEAGFSEENEDYFLRKYFDNNVPSGIKTRILCYKILWDYLWAEWTVIKEANGDDFGNYGPMRFNRAIENLARLESAD